MDEQERFDDENNETADSGSPGNDERAGDVTNDMEALLLVKTESEAALLARLRQALIDSDPLVEPELVQGNTIAELEDSFAKAKAAAERAKGIVLEQGVTRVPAGAPGRRQRNPVSPFDKIREGLKARY